MTAADSRRVDVFDAEARLPELIQQVEGGEEIVISRSGNPEAKLIPLSAADIHSLRKGPWEGQVWLAPDLERAEGPIFYASVDPSTASS